MIHAAESPKVEVLFTRTGDLDDYGGGLSSTAAEEYLLVKSNQKLNQPRGIKPTRGLGDLSGASDDGVRSVAASAASTRAIGDYENQPLWMHQHFRAIITAAMVGFDAFGNVVHSSSLRVQCDFA